jgi:hypothetical protein
MARCLMRGLFPLLLAILLQGRGVSGGSYDAPIWVEEAWSGSFVKLDECQQDAVHCSTDEAACYAEAASDW